jgi:5-formyltetrahydrofolate cyclo-ligase
MDWKRIPMSDKLLSVIAMNKAQMREQLLAWRNGLTMEEIEDKSAAICRTLLSMEEYDRAKTIMVYSAFGKEVNLRKLIEAAWADGKSVVFPRVDRKRKQMEGFYVGSFEHFLARVTPDAISRKIAVAFSGQILDEVPSEPHDALVDFIVTEKEVIRRLR